MFWKRLDKLIRVVIPSWNPCNSTSTHHVLVGLECDLEDVSLLGLREEEEHGLGLVRGRAHEDHPPLGVVQVVAPPRDRAPDVGLVMLFRVAIQIHLRWHGVLVKYSGCFIKSRVNQLTLTVVGNAAQRCLSREMGIGYQMRDSRNLRRFQLGN